MTYNYKDTRPHTFRYHTFDLQGRIIPGSREQAAHFLPDCNHPCHADPELKTLADELADYHNKHGKPPSNI